MVSVTTISKGDPGQLSGVITATAVQMEALGKRCSAEVGDASSGQEAEAKRPRVDGQAVEMNSCYTNCAEFQQQLTTCWRNGQDFHDESTGCELLTKPFPCCILPNFIASESGGFLEKLKSELLRLKFHEKNNDLYQFHQEAIVGVVATTWESLLQRFA